MSRSASYFDGGALRVFALSAGLAFAFEMMGTYLIQRIGDSDAIKSGAPIAGFAAAILISNYLDWLTLRATPWPYLKAAAGLVIAMPAAFAVFIGLSAVSGIVIDRMFPSTINKDLLFAAAGIAFLSGSAVCALLTGYTLTGVWDWPLLGAMYFLMWLAVLTPSPWDRPFVCVLGGLTGLWLSPT